MAIRSTGERTSPDLPSPSLRLPVASQPRYRQEMQPPALPGAVSLGSIDAYIQERDAFRC